MFTRIIPLLTLVLLTCVGCNSDTADQDQATTAALLALTPTDTLPPTATPTNTPIPPSSTLTPIPSETPLPTA